MRVVSAFALLACALAARAPAQMPGALAGDAPSGAAAAAEVATLRRELTGLVRPGGRASARYGVIVVSLDRGDTLFSLDPDLPLAPASNLKLFSTAAALYYLGPDFRYSTYVLGTGPVEGGVLQGDLILYGTGDPAISWRMLGSTRSAFTALVDSLAARGVTEVAGDVVGDGSYFDDAWIGEGWNESDRMASYAAPIGALSFSENLVNVRVLPGGAAGQPARVQTTPQTDGLAIVNRVRTVASGTTRVRFSHGEEGLVLEGQIARRHGGVRQGIPVVDPGNYAAAAFRAALEEKGIAVRGEVRSVRDPSRSPVSLASRGAAPAALNTPAARVLAVHLSPPLLEIVEVTNQISQNLFADALLKTAGRVALGDGSFAGGARAVKYFLECEAGVDTAALHLVDGSGLSRLNRVTARSAVQLLAFMPRSGVWDAYLASLPLAASPHRLDHSLRRRMGGSPAAANLQAKTGTIRNVSALSGYVTAANGERLAFAILVNDAPSSWAVKRTEDAIGIRLARFTRGDEGETGGLVMMEEIDEGPAPTTTAPAPAAPAAAPVTAPAPEARAAPAAAERANRTHRVRSGDTLDGIARRYGTTVAELRRLNPRLQPRRLQIGQRVTIPAGE